MWMFLTRFVTQLRNLISICLLVVARLMNSKLWCLVGSIVMQLVHLIMRLLLWGTSAKGKVLQISLMLQFGQSLYMKFRFNGVMSSIGRSVHVCNQIRRILCLELLSIVMRAYQFVIFIVLVSIQLSFITNRLQQCCGQVRLIWL